MKVTFVQRKKGEFWSLEEVFDTVRAHLPAWCEGNLVIAPAHGGRLSVVLRNLVWARSLRGKVFHVTGDIHYVVLGLRRKPVVLTVHDVRFLEDAWGLKRLLLWLLWLYLPAQGATGLTAISQETKDRLVKLGRVKPQKVRVIPNPVSPVFRPMAKPWNSDQQVLLHVGTTSNKNLERVMEACAGLGVELWILGRLNEGQTELLEKSGLAWRSWSDLPRTKVAELYRNCDLVIFPSLYEGFGMPILEGQAVGRPVLTSDRSPMREVAGNGALLVNPESVESIRTGLKRLLEDEGLRAELVRRGFENVKRYSPEVVAAQYAEVYREVLGP